MSFNPEKLDLLWVRAFPNKECSPSEDSDLSIAGGSLVQKTMSEGQPGPGTVPIAWDTGMIKGASDPGILTDSY